MKKYILLFFLLIGVLSAHAQKSQTRKGDIHFKAMAYPKAIPFYLKAVKKDSTYQDAVFKLADCYRLTNNRAMAEEWYAKAVKMSAVLPIHKFYYGQALMNNGKFAQAKKWMTDFVIDNNADGRGQAFVKAIDTYQNFFIDSSNYAITKLDINTNNADFGAALYQEGIVFASSRPKTEMIERKHAWTNQPFLDLYYSRGQENKFRAPEMFAAEIQTKLNDGPVAFNKKGDELWVTRNNIVGTKVHKSSDKIVKLKLFKSSNKGGNEWGKLESFEYNSDNYSCAHAALSPDGQRLYFSSDMPGSKGGMDIFMCTKQGNGWSNPVNLGDTVNTRGNELFPAVMDDGTIYYSSDGLPGLGGLDIFFTRDLGNRFTVPVNVGYPINTYDDDFNMVYDLKNKIGYLSSNRANKGFDDDLYTFKKKSLRIKGIVVRKEDGTPINQAHVELKTGDKAQNFTTMENGRFDFPADFDLEYVLKGSATDLGDSTVFLQTSGTYPGDPFVRIELGKKSAEFALSILVIDAETKQPLPGSMIRDDEAKKDIGSTDLAGRYTQPIVPQKDEQLLISMAGYRPKMLMLQGQNGEAPKNHEYVVELTKASDLTPFENWFKIIYYDLDKYSVREDATKVLDEVAAFLIENRNVKISLSSSTDSRATAEYNEKLSHNRSKSARQYLIDKGVYAKQLAKVSWSGESVLVNDCGDESPCSEELHQLNRRTEMMVVEVKK
ncbi:MAG: OmpA family protein [Bacteroidia bacterium]|nr:OmpA family protein [Bacteroidia bacterium]MBP7243719.1 OmpA family protein [Bacteroidia bacterium]